VDGIPSETVVRDRTRESSALIVPTPKYIVHAAVIEGPVGERDPSRERHVRKVGRSGISQTPPITIVDIRTIFEITLRKDEPFFPTGTAPVGGNLGLEVGSESGVAGERVWIVSRTVVEHGGGGD